MERFGKARAATMALLGSTMLATSGAAFAQIEADQPADDLAPDIIVTAQKRAENLQDVPIAITAIGTEKLEELQVSDFEDYARYLPSLSYKTAGPGFSNVYFRGVASGENANHSASLPSVCTYLDEQPITTTTGALDLHIYDVARVEALAGPQGTLYGASCQAGAVKIVTNKPDTTGFYGAATAEVNTVAHGGEGYIAEGFVNAPINETMAFRVVGWYRKDAGYIDNVPGTLVFPINQFDDDGNLVNLPGDDISFSNAGLVEDDYNDVETYGARAALKIDLDDNWTLLPQIMGQKQVSDGFFGQETGLGDLQVQQFNPEHFDDRWFQAALTIEGKIGDWDMTYAGAYLKRKIDGETDYVDYAYFYDALAGYAQYFYDNDGNQVNPNQYIISADRFTKQSHELRFASPSTERVRFIGGLFYQRQTHNIEQNYIIDNIADAITVTGTESNIWLTKQLRVDRDYALFGELTADVTDKLSVTFGGRLYQFNNTLVGFFGYSAGFSSGTGEAACFGPAVVDGSPCTNLGVLGPNGEIRPKRSKNTDFLHRLNATYKFNDDALVYATLSRGFRPGGVNRRGGLPPYQADFIDNYELGLKTSWFDNRLRFNAAVYQLNWSSIQLSFLGPNGLTEIRNAGNARIRGIESDVLIRPVRGLSISLGAAYNDAQIRNDFCKIANQDFNCASPGLDGTANEKLASAGTRLPITAKFKGNALTRYEFPIGAMRGHLQGALTYEGRRTTDLRDNERAIKGDLPSYTTVDLSAGVETDRWSAEIFATNLFDELGFTGVSIQCNENICGDPGGDTAIGPKLYHYVIQPRTIGLKVGVKF